MPYKDLEKQRKYQRERNARIRKEWLDYNGPCVKCGSNLKLEVDHIDPKTKVSHKVWTWSKKRREEELEKCQVLCSLCHKKKSNKENTGAPAKKFCIKGHKLSAETRTKPTKSNPLGKCKICHCEHNKKYYKKNKPL